MKNLLKIKSVVTLAVVIALVVYMFMTKDDNVVLAMTTAFAVVVGSLFSKKDSTTVE